MNKRAVRYLAMTTCLMVLVLFGISISVPPKTPPGLLRLDYNHVRGSAVEHQVPYTLNFEQQNALITYVNAAETSNMQPSTAAPTPYSKIIIYRFNAPNTIITPLTYIGDNLLFSTPEWNEGKPLLDTSQGKLKHLLETSYDHA
jgi:hypothetical protein